MPVKLIVTIDSPYPTPFQWVAILPSIGFEAARCSDVDWEFWKARKSWWEISGRGYDEPDLNK